ncbi:twin-arginine translocation signal domain-containing protein, partial [Streptomyces sp. SID724]|nr:twin-arginine translocation signal domain-containing protein [Streptomyces sp. SID724]
MSVTRRTLLTATAAGTLLAALWFVPSANATGEHGDQGAPAA